MSPTKPLPIPHIARKPGPGRGHRRAPAPMPPFTPQEAARAAGYAFGKANRHYADMDGYTGRQIQEWLAGWRDGQKEYRRMLLSGEVEIYARTPSLAYQRLMIEREREEARKPVEREVRPVAVLPRPVGRER